MWPTEQIIAFTIIELQLIGTFMWTAAKRRTTPISVITSKAKAARKKVIDFTATEIQQAQSIPQWVHVYKSVIGLQHTMSKKNIPCQDSCEVLPLSESCGIAVVSDGAGSAENSHLGSAFVSKKAIELFSGIIEANNWMHGELPNYDEWDTVAKNTLRELRKDLQKEASDLSISLKSMACTVIVLIYTDKGILITHIGDGRAAYQNEQGEWIAIMSPHSGEEANQTIFLSSEYWDKDDATIGNIPIPESRIIEDCPTAFTLMSDGCENHAFELGYFNKAEERFVKQNKPSKVFFDSLINSIASMYSSGESKQEMQEKWERFLSKGTQKIESELDDKTMIIGVKVTPNATSQSIHDRQGNNDIVG